jgi:hypothetical protein
MSLRVWERTDDLVYMESHEFHDREFDSLMRFRLVYDGPLFAVKSGNPRAEHKHDIRKAFHSQLHEFWKTDPTLKTIYERRQSVITAGSNQIRSVRTIDHISEEHPGGAIRFLPFVRRNWGLACSLDILMLRRGNPGDIINQGGDLDNRIKTLFDALAIPAEGGRNFEPTPDEKPFFVLLEDDALITHVSVSTDRWLMPVPPEAGTSTHLRDNVRLIIKVETVIVNPDKSFIDFLR